MNYQCSICGGIHDELPDIGVAQPDQWWNIPEAERGSRIKLSADTCIIDSQDFFIRGVIHLPVHGLEHDFGFGVWVSQKRENFFTYLEHFDTSAIGPFFGWLCTRLGCYKEDTSFLKTMVHFRGQGERPTLQVEPTDHLLAREQREGISQQRAWDIVHYYIEAHNDKE